MKILFILFVATLVAGENKDAKWNSKQVCWTRKRGVCVKNGHNFACPFSSGSTWWKGCPKDYTCCVPPPKAVRYPPITSLQCGHRAGDRSTTTDRVVGGFRVKLGEYPWQVLIRYFGRPHCGGSVLSDRWVITAAHCIKFYDFKDMFSVDTGFVELDKGKDLQKVRVVKTIVHESFNNPPYSHDIALLRLEKPLRIDNFTRPICLPRRGDSFKDYICTVSGWGWNGQQNARNLTGLNLPTIPYDQCIKAPASGKYIVKHNMCAGFKAGERDACQGDSGGPFACRVNSGQWLLAGLVSWGEGCAMKGEPAVLTRVTSFLDWIEQRTGLRWS